MASSTKMPVQGVAGAKAERPAAGRLRGSLGTRALVLSAVAMAAPLAGTTGYVSVTIAYGNGLGTPATFVVTTVALALFSIGFGALAKFVPRPGSFYAYITAGLGKPVGLGASFLTLLAYFIIGVGFYAFAGLTLQGTITRFGGPDLPWWLCSLAFWLVVGIFGYLRIGISAKMLSVVLIIEVIAIVIFDAVVMGRGGPQGVTASVFSPSHFFSGELGLALVLAVTMFQGFESTAIYREETVNPGRTIARATIICVLLIGAFYTITSWSVITGLGPSHAVQALTKDLTGSFFTIASGNVGPWYGNVTSVLLITSIFASQLAIQNMVSRYIYSLAKDGILPKPLAAVHSYHSSPYRASLATSATMVTVGAIIIAIGLTPDQMYAWFAGGGAITIVTAMGLTALAAVVYFTRHRDLKISVWRGRVAPAVATAYFAGCLVFAVMNLPALIGGSRALSNGMIVVFVAVFAIGVAVALRLRTSRPEVYARIGRQEG